MINIFTLLTLTHQMKGGTTMSDSNETWRDLTVDNADDVSAFYQHVLGWEKEPVDMNGYHDYIMKDAAGNVMGGICHRQGANMDVPGGWITYFTVSDFDEALLRAKAKLPFDAKFVKRMDG